MKLIKLIFTVLLITLISFSCGEKKNEEESMKQIDPPIPMRLKQFAQVKIEADLSHLTPREMQMIKILVRAGKFADAIFWKQNSPDGISIRDSLAALLKGDARAIHAYVLFHYGPYDAIYDNERFVGNGPEKKPLGANLYPLDLTKEEFNSYIQKYPNEKQELESQYTVVTRENGRLKAIPYYQAYPETEEIAKLLEEAATYCDNEYLKKYLLLRAADLRKGDFYESDMAWMDLKDNNIDIVIGPIENYIDGLFNYKTAYECILMVKDNEATKELEMFESLLDEFEHRLPVDSKYKRKTAGKGNILQIVNVVYFGGDCQAGIKTIATSLPNDPKVIETKGAKKSMFKNMMEAKFDKILKPIGNIILDKKQAEYVDKKAFTSFVTLHEVSHTLGLSYVYGQQDITVRKALQEKYSAIEECKADVLGMYNHKHLLNLKKIDAEYLEKAMITYLVGLFRSIRFGAEEAHGISNLIQLNYLAEKGAILFQNDKVKVDDTIFMDKIEELARLVLTIQAEGNYKAATELVDKYGKMNDKIKSILKKLESVPRDLNTTYAF